MSRDSTAQNENQDIPRNDEGVDTRNQEDEVNPASDPRGARMQDLVARKRQERDEEMRRAAEGDETGDEQLPSISDLDDGEGQGKPIGDPPPQEKMYRLVVDGQEVEKPESWMIAQSQKLLAADRRLAEAAREKQELLREKELLQQEQARRQQELQQQSKPPEQSGASDDVNELVNQALEGIYSGDDDAARKALAQLAAGRHTPIQQDEIDRRVRQAVEAVTTEQERARELKSAADKFKTEFNDIASDPELWEMADRYTLDVANEHPEYAPYQIMQEAGNRVRKWISRYRGEAGLSDRTQRKRQAMGAVPSANRAAALGQDEPPPKTRRDVLSEMRRARGQNFA